MLQTSQRCNLVRYPNGTMSRNRVLNFYNHSTADNPRWSEFSDLREEERRSREKANSFPVVHRKSLVNSTWVTHSIEAKSPELRYSLDMVFKNYPEWYPNATPYVIFPPFKAFVHLWHEFGVLCDVSGPTPDYVNHLLLLKAELEHQVKFHLLALDGVKATGAVSFDKLWLILAPGRLMLSSRGGKPQVFRLVEAVLHPATPMGPAYYELILANVDWNGQSTAVRVTTQRIFYYHNAISLQKLEVVPAEFSEDWGKIRESALSRGRKFEALRGFHVKAYSGIKYSMKFNPTGNLVETATPVCCFPALSQFPSLSSHCLSFMC